MLCEISHSALQLAHWGKNDTTGISDGVLRKT